MFKFSHVLLLVLCCNVFAYPKRNNDPTPPPNPPSNTTWIFGGCLPSSANPNSQCAMVASLWSGTITIGEDGCNEWTLPFWCANYKEYDYGYYPTRYGENVLNGDGYWNYTGCVSNEISPYVACKGEYNETMPFMYGKTPNGSRYCQEINSTPLWCATTTYAF